VTALRVQPLLQHVERQHATLAQDQQFAVDRRRQAQALQQVGKALRYVLAGARIKPCDAAAVCVVRAHRLHADAVPFPFRHEVRRLE
jgi:hypothetical protein